MTSNHLVGIAILAAGCLVVAAALVVVSRAVVRRAAADVDADGTAEFHARLDVIRARNGLISDEEYASRGEELAGAVERYLAENTADTAE